jgi:hypothetical protein
MISQSTMYVLLLFTLACVSYFISSLTGPYTGANSVYDAVTCQTYGTCIVIGPLYIKQFRVHHVILLLWEPTKKHT